MEPTSGITAALFIAFLATGAMGIPKPAYAACEAGSKIDGSTAETATRKLAAAAFTKIRDLKKGCDNFWHATASKDGADLNVSLSPSGVIAIESK